MATVTVITSMSQRVCYNYVYNYALHKTLLTFIILLYVLLIFRDYVKICYSSVDGFTQHVSYFCCTLISTYVSDTGV